MIQMLCILIQIYNKTLIFHLTKGNFVMKIFNSNIRKLSLSIALVGMVMIGQSAWACEKPKVSGYDYVGCLKEDGLAEVQRGSLGYENYGYIDKTGKVVIPVQYDRAFRSGNHNTIIVRKDKKWGILDKTGAIIVPLQYDKISGIGDEMMAVEKDNKAGFMDKTGHIVIPLQYDGVYNFADGLALVSKNGKFGFIDETGTVIIPLRYTYKYGMTTKFEKEQIFAKVSRYDNWLYASRYGKEYTSVGELKENRAYVFQSYADEPTKAGFVDKTGKEVIPLIYQDVNSFSNGLASVKKDEKWGYIDTNGKTLIDFQYEYATSFENGKARVAFGDDGKSPKYFYIDKTGKILTTRTSLADFRKKLEQGDDVYYQTADGSGKGMIFEIKGNLVQVQTKESQCSQRDYKGNCQNYIENQVGKWVKKSEVYPTNHFD